LGLKDALEKNSARRAVAQFWRAGIKHDSYHNPRANRCTGFGRLTPDKISPDFAHIFAVAIFITNVTIITHSSVARTFGRNRWNRGAFHFLLRERRASPS
jgi:hypothetical protein